MYFSSTRMRVVSQRLARHHANLRKVRNVVGELRSHVREMHQPNGVAAVFEIRIRLIEVFPGLVS